MLLTDFIEASSLTALRRKMLEIQIALGSELTFTSISIFQKNGKDKFVAWFKRPATQDEMKRIIA